MALPSLSILIGYPFIRVNLKKHQRFAPDAVGNENDGFDVAPAAKRIAEELKKAEEYVIVAEISANKGWGKSSFAR